MVFDVAALTIGIAIPVTYMLYYILMPTNHNKIETFKDYFLAGELLQTRDLFDTLGASWLLLGNVILANIALATAYGWINWWLIVTWALAFYLTDRHAPRINQALQRTELDILHTFLGHQLNSPAVRYGAATLTTILSIGIVALEIIVGMSLVSPLFTSNGMVWLLATGFATTLLITVYAVAGGLWAIVETDTVQMSLIIAGLIAFVLITLRFSYSAAAQPIKESLINVSWNAAATAGWPYYVGIFFLQLPFC